MVYFYSGQLAHFYSGVDTHARLPCPQLAVRVDGNVYGTVEWSQGNLVVACAGGYRIGALVMGRQPEGAGEGIASVKASDR